LGSRVYHHHTEVYAQSCKSLNTIRVLLQTMDAYVREQGRQYENTTQLL